MNKEILIVEYSPDTIDSIKEMLYHEIFEISVAGTAEVAKALLAKKRFDLVIVEALLPKSHGFDLSEYISKNNPNTNVVIISDKLKKLDYKKEAKRHGACDFFEKPLDPAKFKSRMLKHLGITSPSEPNASPGETTKIHVLPLLDQLDIPESEFKKTDSREFDDIIKKIKETDSYKIDLEDN